MTADVRAAEAVRLTAAVIEAAFLRTTSNDPAEVSALVDGMDRGTRALVIMGLAEMVIGAMGVAAVVGGPSVLEQVLIAGKALRDRAEEVRRRG